MWFPCLLAVAAWPTDSNEMLLLAVGSLGLISFALLLKKLGLRTAADAITVCRCVAAGVLVMISGLQPELNWLVSCGFVGVGLLDLVDGWVARRWGATSAGAVLDMEADQFAVLFMSATATVHGLVGPWVLLLPAYRYLYVVVLAPFGLVEADPNPDGGNRRAKLVCLLTVVSLLLILFPLTPESVRWVVGLVAVCALGCSFSVDAAAILARHGRRWESA